MNKNGPENACFESYLTDVEFRKNVARKSPFFKKKYIWADILYDLEEIKWLGQTKKASVFGSSLFSFLDCY